SPTLHCAVAGTAITAMNISTAARTRIVTSPQYMTRLIQPFVMLLSPLTNQLKPGYEAPTMSSSTAVPTTSSLLLKKDVIACHKLLPALAYLYAFTVTELESLPPVRSL